MAGALTTLLVLGLATGAGAAPVPPPADAPDPQLTEIVVTATRTAQGSFALPASVDRIDSAAIRRGQSQVNLSESLVEVPGISIQSRQNYAQDLQLSIRGFGARSNFGVRGVRLYADGIPGTMPDGQGQFSHFDLGSAEHIEVLRGPFSALYGNSSGGVIAIFTEEGEPGFDANSYAEYGSLDTRRYALKADGDSGALNYLLDAAHFETEGFRDHSRAERNTLNGRLRLTLSDLSKLTFTANAIETPFTQDPLGLTSVQLAADPRQAGTNALAFNTRKSLVQEQLGAAYQRSLGDNDDLTATLYGGHRATTQFQAIPLATQAPPTSPGGVIDLARIYDGLDVHATDRREPGDTKLQVTAGVSYDDLDEHRRGYNNYVGPQLGVEGLLRRYQTNLVHDLDEYLQAQWDVSSLRFIAGARHSTVNVSSFDHLAAANVSPLSGVRYSSTDPVAGVSYRPVRAVSLYASYGRGFETPTLNDLAYRSTNGSLPGLNFALQPARSNNYEAGIKTETGWLRADVDVFYIRTQHELAVLQNTAGRSVFQNIDETQRKGGELGLTALPRDDLSVRLAYTYLHAYVAEPYQTCITLPCTLTSVAAGNRLPAVPENSLYAGVTWKYPRFGFTATLESFARGQIYANDLNSQAAAGYWSENLRLGLEQSSGGWNFSEFLRIENLTDRSYVGSVIVNESNTRYFEPAPGRGVYLMLTAQKREPGG